MIKKILTILFLSSMAIAYQNCAESGDGAMTDGSAEKPFSGAAIKVTSYPVSRSVNEGDTFTLSVSATSGKNLPLSFTWYKDGAPTGVADENISILSANPGVQGNYECEISDGETSIRTASAFVDVITIDELQSILILVQPKPLSIYRAAAGTLTVEASSKSGGSVTFQWYKGDTPIAGATTTTLAFSNALVEQTGSYSVLVSDGLNSLRSNVVAVSVTAPPQMVFNVNAATGCKNGFCACVTLNRLNVPDQARANAICKIKGYATAKTFKTAAGPINKAHCTADGSSCFINRNAGNIICTAVTCQ